MAFSHVRDITTGTKKRDGDYRKGRQWKGDHCMGRGFKYLKENRYQEAAAYFTKAIQREPGLAEAYNNVGYCRLMSAIRTTDINLSIPYFSKALKLNPKYAHALYNRGVARLKLGSAMLRESGHKTSDQSDRQFEMARDDFSSCVKADRFFAKAYHNRAVCECMLRKAQKASGNLTRAILIHDEESVLHRVHNTGAFMPIEEKQNLLEGGSKSEVDSLLLEDSSLLQSEPSVDNTRMKTNTMKKGQTNIDKYLETMGNDDNEHGNASEAEECRQKQDEILAWQKAQAYRKLRMKLHATASHDKAKHDCLKSLESRQFVHERRVETEIAEVDRAAADLLRIDLGLVNPSHDEEHVESSGNGNTEDGKISRAEKIGGITKPEKTVGKAGSMIQTRKRR